MMQSANWRGMALPVLCLALIACGSNDARAKTDPNAPAVVRLPPPVLESDTAKKEVPPVVTNDDARLMLTRNYALLGAALSFNDARSVMQEYSPAAELTTSNGTFVGTAAVAKEIGNLANGKSVKQFNRVSRTFHLVDSTVVDSGSYTIVLSRAAADSSVERGTYAAIWKIQAPPLEWVITKDHLIAAAAKKRK